MRVRAIFFFLNAHVTHVFRCFLMRKVPSADCNIVISRGRSRRRLCRRQILRPRAGRKYFSRHWYTHAYRMRCRKVRSRPRSGARALAGNRLPASAAVVPRPFPVTHGLILIIMTRVPRTPTSEFHDPLSGPTRHTIGMKLGSNLPYDRRDIHLPHPEKSGTFK